MGRRCIPWSDSLTRRTFHGGRCPLTYRRSAVMRTGSGEFEEALLRGDRTYDAQIRLGGRDVTEEVSSWSIGRSLESGLPAEVATPTGSTAAETSLTLVGDDESTAA